MKEHEYRVFLEAVRCMEEQVERNLQVGEIAAKIHVSESSLQRCFRACAGSGVHEYLLQLKLKKAMEALQRGESVGAVAEASGFVNRNHFSACFKKHFGVNPSKIDPMRTQEPIGIKIETKQEMPGGENESKPANSNKK